MSALDEVGRILGPGRTDLAGLVVDALDVAGYLVDPDRNLRVVLRDLAVTDTLMCFPPDNAGWSGCADAVTEWNGDTLVGVTFPVGWRAVAA